MNRTILIISAVFVLTLGIVLGTYFFFLQGNNGGTSTSIRDVLPFGLGGSDRETSSRTPLNANETSTGSASTDSTPILELRQLHEKPVAGAITFEEAGTSTVRFVERESGHVFEITEEERTPRRITNTTLPRIQEALWATKEMVLLRYLSDTGDVQTFVAKVTLASAGDGVGELQGTFLPPDIISLAVRPGAAFYTVLGEERGYVENLTSGVARSILPIPFTEWLPSWISPNRLALTSKPSASAAGVLYTLNTETGSLSRVLGGRFGLVTLVSPDGNQVLFSERSSSGFSLHVFAIDSGSATALPQRTIPEKCAWSSLLPKTAYCGVPDQVPGGEYPDVWYQGKISFTDAVWALNTADGSAELLKRPLDVSGAMLDITNPLLTEDESHFVFTNKKDGTLWSLVLPSDETATQ
ncbi:MAG TPA: hypothetical protein VGA06_01940 [Candidatus Paceibacterota bacterium]|jgi:hypothetical protein